MPAASSMNRGSAEMGRGMSGEGRDPPQFLVVHLAEQLLGLAPVPRREPEGHVAAPEAVEGPVRRQRALAARGRGVLPPRHRALEIVEVAHPLPAVEAGIADVDVWLAHTAPEPPQHGSTLAPPAAFQPGAERVKLARWRRSRTRSRPANAGSAVPSATASCTRPAASPRVASSSTCTTTRRPARASWDA